MRALPQGTRWWTPPPRHPPGAVATTSPRPLRRPPKSAAATTTGHGRSGARWTAGGDAKDGGTAWNAQQSEVGYGSHSRLRLSLRAGDGWMLYTGFTGGGLVQAAGIWPEPPARAKGHPVPTLCGDGTSPPASPAGMATLTGLAGPPPDPRAPLAGLHGGPPRPCGAARWPCAPEPAPGKPPRVCRAPQRARQ